MGPKYSFNFLDFLNGALHVPSSSSSSSSSVAAAAGLLLLLVLLLLHLPIFKEAVM